MKAILELKKVVALSIFFSKRDIKARFAGSFLGTAWLILYPLCLIAMFYFVFSQVLKIKIPGAFKGSFLLFFLSAFFPWLSLQEGLMRASSSILDNAETVKKVPFPLESLPLGMVLSSSLCHFSAFFLFYAFNLATFLFHKGPLPFVPLFLKSALSILILLFFQTVMVSGIALLLSSICAYLRDLVQVVSLVLQLWFYATPVVYPIEMVPEPLKRILFINPYLGFVQGYREAIFSGLIRLDAIKAYSFIFSLAIFIFGLKVFEKLKQGFADVL